MQKENTSDSLGATGTKPTDPGGRVNCDSHTKFEAGVLVFCRHSLVYRRPAGGAWPKSKNPASEAVRRESEEKWR
jgi:hypothetical protein